MRRAILFASASCLLFLSACLPMNRPARNEPTTTPEVFIPLDKAIPDYGIVLKGVRLRIAGTTLSDQFPLGCTGLAPLCTHARDGSRILSVRLAPRDLPAGQMLAYKELPAISVAVEGGTNVPFTLSTYNNANHNLTVGFEVPANARVFALRWDNLAAIPLHLDAQE